MKNLLKIQKIDFELTEMGKLLGDYRAKRISFPNKTVLDYLRKVKKI